MNWEILDTGCRSAEENMAIDSSLLANLQSRPRPVLHFYEWKGDSATYGHFIEPADFLNLDQVKKKSLQLAKRSTGGGITFHLWDMAFSVLVPAHCPQFSTNTLENYAFVNNAVRTAAAQFLDNPTLTPVDLPSLDPSCQHFCMAKPTKYDVVYNGRKIAGAAQRKTKAGFLHQGTISLIMPPIDYLESILKPGTEVLNAMQALTHPLLGSSATSKEMDAAKRELRKIFISVFL